MQSASKNLVPVTLELAVSPRRHYLAQNLIWQERGWQVLLNGGHRACRQTTLVPTELEEQLIERVVDEAQSMYPNITENRLRGCLQ